MSDGRVRRHRAICIVFLAAACAAGTNAQDGDERGADEPRVAKACVDEPTIKRTQVLNDRNIVFVTRDDAVYNNALPRECPTLRRGSLVNYAINNRELCAGGLFQVLWQTGNGSYTPAFTCRLGMFVPISESQLEDLVAMTEEDEDRRRSRRRSSGEAVTSEPVELPKRPETAPAAPAE